MRGSAAVLYAVLKVPIKNARHTVSQRNKKRVTVSAKAVTHIKSLLFSAYRYGTVRRKEKPGAPSSERNIPVTWSDSLTPVLHQITKCSQLLVSRL